MKTQTPLAVSMLKAGIIELRKCIQMDQVKNRIKDYELAIKILNGETVKRELLIEFMSYLSTEMRYTTETDYDPEEQVDVFINQLND